LLDEVMAELDDDRRRLLLRLMESHPQVLATTANIDAFPADFRERSTVMRVEPGKIEATAPARARAS
jgi:recombinational DNA repair ATPase RecF